MLKNTTKFFTNLFLLISLFINACGNSNDPCADTDCGETALVPTGKCVQGICECNLGYESANCADEWTFKFRGNYIGNEILDNTPLPTPLDNMLFRDTSYQIEENRAIRMVQKSPTILNISGLANTYSNTFDVFVSKQDSTSVGAYKIVCTNLLGVPLSDSYNTKLTMNATYNPSEKSLKGTYFLKYQGGRTTQSVFDYRKR
jgi:hypothetical protein